jgi:hypothetical protein
MANFNLAGMCKDCSLSGNKWYAGKSCGDKSCSNRNPKGFEDEPHTRRCKHGMACDYINDINHCKKYFHTPIKCKNGNECNIPGKYHSKKYHWVTL